MTAAVALLTAAVALLMAAVAMVIACNDGGRCFGEIR
jgi:hypothetical protein